MAVNALMQFVLNGAAIAGESQSEIDKEDDLANSGSTWTAGHFFEVEEFEFNLELDEHSGVDGGSAGGGSGGLEDLQRQINELRSEIREDRKANFAAGGGAKKDGDKKSGVGSSKGGRFDEYVTGKQDPAGYKPRVAPFSFKKQIDLASTTLIRNCFTPTKFDKATLIKRKDVGGTGGGGAVANLTYVRFDFLEPLIISVDLSAEDVQTVKFVSRQVTVTYASQLSSGQTKVQTNAAVLKLNAAT